MKKQISIFIILTVFFMMAASGRAQEAIDFESSPIDVLADAAYQSATPFFPGVLIQTIDNKTGDITGWPVVVRAYEGAVNCGIGIPDPEGTIPCRGSEVRDAVSERCQKAAVLQGDRQQQVSSPDKL